MSVGISDQDKHRNDFSIVDDRAVTQGGHGSGTGCWGDGRGDRATETWNPNCQLKRPSFFQTFLAVICFRSGWKCLYTMLIIDVISPFVGFCSSQPSSITCVLPSSFVCYAIVTFLLLHQLFPLSLLSPPSPSPMSTPSPPSPLHHCQPCQPITLLILTSCFVNLRWAL